MIPLFLAAAALAASPTNPVQGPAEVRLFVRPMPAPVPALKYLLLPDLEELNPGNAAHDYLRCFAEQRDFFYGEKYVADRARYRKMPLVALRLERVKEYGGNPLKRADWAARLDTNDWQALPRIRDAGDGGLPVELGSLQVLVETLHVRFRIEVAENRFDDGIRTAQTMLAMARHLGEHPTEVGGLLAMATAHLALDALEEMVQQPRCPNLYWALTDLPTPLVDLHKAVQGERIRVAAELRPLRGDGPMTDSELDSFISRLSGTMNLAREQAGLPPRNLRPRLRSRADDRAEVDAARHRLVDAGQARDLIDRFSPLQVILLDEKRDYEVRRGERAKLMNLPLWQIEDRETGEEPDRDRFLAELLPGIITLRRTQAALEQQIALLRHVEAIRLHAAAHDGQPPARLSDVAVPLPDDPVTGRPFAYSTEGATTHLRGGSPRGPGRAARPDVHYVVTLLK